MPSKWSITLAAVPVRKNTCKGCFAVPKSNRANCNDVSRAAEMQGLPDCLAGYVYNIIDMELVWPEH